MSFHVGSVRLHRRALALIVGVGALTGCPLPVAHTVTTSPAVVGRLEWADGRRAADVPVIVAAGWKNSSCSNPTFRTRTDSEGIFRFEADTQHFDKTWFIPNLDVAVPAFRLCAAVGDSVQQGYAGSGSPFSAMAPDTVRCVVWDWMSRRRVSCAGRDGQSVVDGGRWSADSGVARTGFYRLFLTTEPTRVEGSDDGALQPRSYLYLQWIAADSAARSGLAPRLRVVTTMSLPFDREKTRGAQNVWLWQRDGHWMASLDHASVSSFAGNEIVFELGPPGHATLVAGQ